MALRRPCQHPIADARQRTNGSSLIWRTGVSGLITTAQPRINGTGSVFNPLASSPVAGHPGPQLRAASKGATPLMDAGLRNGARYHTGRASVIQERSQQYRGSTHRRRGADQASHNEWQLPDLPCLVAHGARHIGDVVHTLAGKSPSTQDPRSELPSMEVYSPIDTRRGPRHARIKTLTALTDLFCSRPLSVTLLLSCSRMETIGSAAPSFIEARVESAKAFGRGGPGLAAGFSAGNQEVAE